MIRSENRIREVVRLELLRMLRNKVEWGPTSFSVFFFKQKRAYEILAWMEFRRVLFRSTAGANRRATAGSGGRRAGADHRRQRRQQRRRALRGRAGPGLVDRGAAGPHAAGAREGPAR